MRIIRLTSIVTFSIHLPSRTLIHGIQLRPSPLIDRGFDLSLVEGFEAGLVFGGGGVADWIVEDGVGGFIGACSAGGGGGASSSADGC